MDIPADEHVAVPGEILQDAFADAKVGFDAHEPGLKRSMENPASASGSASSMSMLMG
jgi:hypothetical protein